MVCSVDSNNTTAAAAAAAPGSEAVLCPFLRSVMPDTSSWFSFLADIQAGGCDWFVGAIIALGVSVEQYGVFNLLFHGAVLDLYRLNIPPTRLDLYNKFKEDVRSQLLERAVDGYVTLQDLVDVKIWIGEQVGQKIESGSQTETTILFIHAGGDSTTKKVRVDVVLDFLQNGISPPAEFKQQVGIFNTLFVNGQSKWQ